jgi:hypothetical protein
MSRTLKIAVALAILISGIVALFMEILTAAEVSVYFGSSAIIMQTVEKYIQPKKEQQLKEEIKNDL